MQPDQERFFEKLYRDFYQWILHQAEKKLGDPVLAQDVTQDTFCAALNRIDYLMTHENPGGWLSLVLKYKILHFYEKQAQKKRLFIDAEDYVEPGELDPNIQALEEESCELLEKIRESLTPEEFHYITCLVLDQASHKQLGQEFHITEIGSKKKRERIIKKLNKKLPEYSSISGKKDKKKKG